MANQQTGADQFPGTGHITITKIEMGRVDFSEDDLMCRCKEKGAPMTDDKPPKFHPGFLYRKEKDAMGTLRISWRRKLEV